MTEDKDLLLQQFFSEAAQQQIEDNGFTERVMQQLPLAEEQVMLTQLAYENQQASLTKIRRFNRLWTVACIAVFGALFIVFRGWELLAIQLEVLIRTWSVESFSINPLMLAAILFGLLFVGVGELITSERHWL